MVGGGAKKSAILLFRRCKKVDNLCFFLVLFSQYPENLEASPQFVWHLNDPLMVYQSMLGVGSLLAFVRIIWWFRASQQLGKLQMMLGASFGDIFKFFFLYIVIYLGFAGYNKELFPPSTLFAGYIRKLLPCLSPQNFLHDIVLAFNLHSIEFPIKHFT